MSSLNNNSSVSTGTFWSTSGAGGYRLKIFVKSVPDTIAFEKFLCYTEDVLHKVRFNIQEGYYENRIQKS